VLYLVLQNYIKFYVKKNKKKKIVPKDNFNLLIPIALAHWISGDGKIHSIGLRLCTEFLIYIRYYKISEYFNYTLWIRMYIS